MNAPWMLVANYLKGVTEASGSLTNPKITEMFRIAGHGEIRDDETPWCAAFVGSCLRLSRFESSNRLDARSYDGFGDKLNTPRTGCIVVFWRESKTSGKGHVAFFDHQDDRYIYTLGGNQGDAVTIKPYDKKRLLGFFWPTKTVEIATSNLIPNIDQLLGDLSTVSTNDRATMVSPDGDSLSRSAVPNTELSSTTIGVSNFGKVQPIVDKWEGGYVDNPQDPGGATNMGITIGTLSRWRGRKVSKDEVRALIRNEVWQIMKAYYYDMVRGDDLPIQVAIAAHNAAVLSGPSASARFLQQSLVELGRRVTIDGAIGPDTIAAIAQSDASQVANAFFDLEEAFYRGLPRFPIFGKGWINRLNDVREYASRINQQVNALDVVETRLPNMVDAPPKIQTISDAQTITKELTPVNAALGETIGKYLDGRKTGLGTLGLLATGLVQTTGPHDPSGLLGSLSSATPYAAPIAGVLAAWGVLGKIDKWVAAIKK